MTTGPEDNANGIADGRVLTGHVAEWGELLSVVQDRRGLTVIVADPWSGTTPLLAGALSEPRPHLPRVENVPAGSDIKHALVDARRCADSLDLAMTIADSSVSALAPEANAWWVGDAPPASTAGLQLHQALSAEGIDLDGLRLGEGRGGDRLLEAVDLTAALARGPVTLAIDHLGVMLANLRGRDARNILSMLRTSRQRHPQLDIILVDHLGGPISEALTDSDHPLYRSGEQLRITRPTPKRFVDDLLITKPWIDEPVELLGAAAEIAAGVPALIWRTVDLAPPDGQAAGRATAGWQRLRQLTTPSLGQQWDLLRRVHPSAQTLVAAISVGLAPHSIPAASKTAADGLNRLRGVGVAWQPEPRRWAIADPLLAAFARQHAPPWAKRRSAYARASQVM